MSRWTYFFTFVFREMFLEELVCWEIDTPLNPLGLKTLIALTAPSLDGCMAWWLLCQLWFSKEKVNWVKNHIY